MLIPFSLIKYIAVFNAVYWPLHALGVRNGIAFTAGFVAWAASFEFFRRRRKRRWYEHLAREQIAAEIGREEDVS